MKKIYLLIAVVLLAGASMAQSSLKFGVKAGGNLANNTFSGNGISMSPTSVTSFYVGGLVTTEISENFAFQPEILLSSQGSKMSLEILGDHFKSTESTLYLNVPLMFKYNVVSGLNLQAGPQIGFLLSAKSKSDGESIDSKEDYKNLDFGANLGAEYQFPKGLFLDARYNLGLANIAKDSGDATVKNSVVSVGLGFRF